uniref:BHLH domain-containing protein n=1 Tax=Macrostomum lignano TaxID=282301 RepID=A0A1I8FK47_9PLAT
ALARCSDRMHLAGLASVRASSFNFDKLFCLFGQLRPRKRNRESENNFPICNIAKEVLMLEPTIGEGCISSCDATDEDIEVDGVENLDFCCGGQRAAAAAVHYRLREFSGEECFENFEMLHQADPKAGVSSDSHRGQLKILQAAIDYIVDLEEQLTEHLSEDLYRVAIRESKAALERSLRARRPFADLNATDEEEDDDCFDMEDLQQQQQQQQQQSFAQQLSAAKILGAESALNRPCCGCDAKRAKEEREGGNGSEDSGPAAGVSGTLSQFWPSEQKCGSGAAIHKEFGSGFVGARPKRMSQLVLRDLRATGSGQPVRVADGLRVPKRHVA